MGKTILEIQNNIYFPYMCALVNNQIIGLSDEIDEDENFELISVELSEGRHTYERSIAFVTKVALKEIDPTLKFTVKNSVEDSLYCKIQGNFNENIFFELKERVKKIINDSIPIRKYNLPKENATKILEKENRIEDISGFRYLLEESIPFYELKNTYGYFAGPLVPNTNFLKNFEIEFIDDGIFILLPSSKDYNKVSQAPKRPKLFDAFKESNEWSSKLEINNVADLNKSIVNGKISNILKIQEALHEMKISEIAKDVISKKSKIILISGPSSSGKTTFAKRLEIQLRANGLKPFVLSLDNYFVDRDKTPKDKEGNPDFESPEAINLDLFQAQILDLIKGEAVDIPRFNFITGKSEKWKTIRIDKYGIVIVEGLHGLNPLLSEKIPESLKFKIYVSVLTQINIDNINRIPTRDHRLIRRIVRDLHHRGIQAIDTIRRWQQVINGEESYIFPNQERADAIFNSSLIYELPILRIYAEAPLRAIEVKEKEYAESLRLLNFLSHFIPLLPDEVPQTSILREFIGKSSFKY